MAQLKAARALDCVLSAQTLSGACCKLNACLCGCTDPIVADRYAGAVVREVLCRLPSGRPR